MNIDVTPDDLAALAHRVLAALDLLGRLVKQRAWWQPRPEAALLNEAREIRRRAELLLAELNRPDVRTARVLRLVNGLNAGDRWEAFLARIDGYQRRRDRARQPEMN